MDAKNGKCTVRDGGRPRRLRTRTESLLSSALSASRKGAGDGLPAMRTGRHKQVRPGRPSAATCRRRKALASTPSPGQAKTPENPPQAINCSMLQATSCPPRTMTRRSSATPAAIQAGTYGTQGGATRASQPPSPDKRPSAGNNRLISPMLLRSTSNSVRQPRGHPPPGNSASSSAWPLGMQASGRAASVSPRQTSPLASTSAKATGNGKALMTAWNRLRGSARRRRPRWRTRPRRAGR